ncbi:hypothetical protein AB0I92_16010 [Micromonospora chalcea]|uniref:hypothetical protein n=1 Tax=Micromonospora chalcea TaxID=1874 RepID=UPI0033CEFBAB
MECTLLLIYVTGYFISYLVVTFRAGLGWHGNKLLGQGGLGVEFLLFSALTVTFWPIALIAWLARGRPEPRIVFNEKARERRRIKGGEGRGA